MPHRGDPSLLVAIVLSVLLGAGCASDGRELRTPEPWQTTTTRPAPPTSAPPSLTGSSGIELSSPDFEPGGPTPLDQTCAGGNRPPALEWTSVPAETAELAITLSEQTDPTKPLLLWLVAGIDPTSAGIDGDPLPAGAVTALNDYGQSGWGNPCLESVKAGRVDLQFRVYVLEQPSGIQENAPGNEAWNTLRAAAVDSASILMTIDGAP